MTDPSYQPLNASLKAEINHESRDTLNGDNSHLVGISLVEKK